MTGPGIDTCGMRMIYAWVDTAGTPRPFRCNRLRLQLEQYGNKMGTFTRDLDRDTH